MSKSKNKTLKIEYKFKNNGLIIKAKGRNFHLTYPKDIWNSYPKEQKNFLIDNLVYLLTVNIPLIAPVDGIYYKNTSLPFFKPLIDLLMIDGIPSAVHSYKDSTFKRLKEFHNYKYIFKDETIKFPIDKDSSKTNKDIAIVPLSFGKDSLSSLGILREIGIKPICIYINDTESPSENKIKLKMIKRIKKEEGIKAYTLTNEIEQLNDFEFWNTEEGCLGYMHMIMGFCLLALPFVHYFKAKYIILGNQQDMNFSFVNKDGFLTYPAPDQNSTWQKQMSKMIKLITSNKTQVASVIEPLTNIALMNLLHLRYSDLGQYEVSCDCLDASKEPRWCHNCPKCARLSLFMKAFGIDTRLVGFKSDLLSKRHKKLYSVFGGKEIDQYEQSQEAKEQQLLAFYLLYKRGERAELIDYFRQKYFKKVQKDIRKLKGKYLRIFETANLPGELRRRILTIFKDQLGC